MKKNWLVVLMICLLTLLPTVVSAEGLELNMRFQYMPSIKPIQGTNLIIMEAKTDNSLGLFNTDGQELLPFGYAAINKLNYGFLSVTKDKSVLNGLAIYKTDGTQISDHMYGTVIAYSTNWIAGTILEEPVNDEQDIKIDKTNYRLAQIDFYHITDEGATLVASMDRLQFKSSKLHGEYFSIQNRDGEMIVYDKNLQPVDGFTPKDVNAAYFKVKNYQIINNITTEAIADGYTAVEEAYMPSRMLLLATVVNEDGSAVQSILDTAGNTLMPAEYKVVTMGDPYVVVADKDGLRGLYSLAEQRLVAPCEFSEIYASSTSIDTYVNNGYVSVEKDGMRGYVDASTGEVTCPPAYNKRIAKVYGCSTVFDGEKGYVLIAGDGTRTELYDYDEIVATNGDGYLLVAKKGGFYGVIDWHGNEMLPFIHKNTITLTEDSKALIRTSTGLELDVIASR